jgi:radical SAM superfamily enzyme YgiQ (UPF0313 family)
MSTGCLYKCRFCQDFTCMTKKLFFDHIKKEHIENVAKILIIGKGDTDDKSE